MKRKLSLLLAIAFAIALFAGCGGNAGGAQNGAENGAKNSAENSSAFSGDSDAPGSGEAAETEEPSPYNLAAGKYEVDSEGWPVSGYDYTLPLATTDETFTHFYITYTPQFIPEGGMEAVPFVSRKAEMTGVSIEYIVQTATECDTTFAVMQAADEIPDMIDLGQNRVKTTLEEAIEDNWFCNIYDYREYMPNYFHMMKEYMAEVPSLKDTLFVRDDMIGTIWTFITVPMEEGWFLRQDWMDKLNLGKAGDVTTVDELHDVLSAFKTAYGDDEHWPMIMFFCFELFPGRMLSGYNTGLWNIWLGYYKRVNNGRIEFCGTTEDDKAAMTTLHQWWDEGLIDPNYGSYTDTGMIGEILAQDRGGYAFGSPSSVGNWESTCVSPDCRFEPVPRLKLYEGQELEWGLTKGVTFTDITVSAKCSNLPLLLTWLDWGYSKEGGEYCTWGIEGETWYYNEKGERRLTDFILKHPAGVSWIMNIHTGGDVCALDTSRNYAYDGGERFLNMFQVWDVSDCYGGKYDYPSGLTLDPESNNEINTLSGDLSAYFSENYTMFLDGSKPLSEWDQYVQTLRDMGMDRVYELYNEALEKYYAS